MLYATNIIYNIKLPAPNFFYKNKRKVFDAYNIILSNNFGILLCQEKLNFTGRLRDVLDSSLDDWPEISVDRKTC